MTRERQSFEQACVNFVAKGLMDAREAATLPEGAVWHYEPKWDGFRCLVCKNENAITLAGRSGKSLTRFFPEVVAGLQALRTPSRFIVDGELVIEIGGALSFEALQMRLHPASSRVKRLSEETPARLIAFDLLWAGKRDYVSKSFADRRAALEKLFIHHTVPHLALTESTTKVPLAKRWLRGRCLETDGVVAKRLDLDYRFGERAMLKIKRHRTADCVVGGFRYRDNKNEIGSLLLGLYDCEGLLHHVGYTSAFSDTERTNLLQKLEKIKLSAGFTGGTPGKPSRWSTERSAAWTLVRPLLIAEVSYDHATGGRFRHGTKFIRWRPDKSPHQCGLDQLD